MELFSVQAQRPTHTWDLTTPEASVQKKKRKVIPRCVCSRALRGSTFGEQHDHQGNIGHELQRRKGVLPKL